MSKTLSKITTFLTICILITRINSLYPFYCTPESRLAEVCTQEWLPVCGWFAKNVNCLVYPCAITTSNICYACQNENVEYVTEGECPHDTKGVEEITYPYLCKELDRQVNVCSDEIMPVCGFSKADCKSQSCFVETSNICTACVDPEVVEVHLGFCSDSFLRIDYIVFMIFGCIILLI